MVVHLSRMQVYIVLVFLLFCFSTFSFFFSSLFIGSTIFFFFYFFIRVLCFFLTLFIVLVFESVFLVGSVNRPFCFCDFFLCGHTFWLFSFARELFEYGVYICVCHKLSRMPSLLGVASHILVSLQVLPSTLR